MSVRWADVGTARETQVQTMAVDTIVGTIAAMRSRIGMVIASHLDQTEKDILQSSILKAEGGKGKEKDRAKRVGGLLKTKLNEQVILSIELVLYSVAVDTLLGDGQILGPEEISPTELNRFALGWILQHLGDGHDFFSRINVFG